MIMKTADTSPGKPLHSTNVRPRLGQAAFLLFALLSAGAGADAIAPFTTDGCSAFPDGLLGHEDLWLECCTEHDYAYWKGGTYQERLDADRKLRACVARVGEPEVAALMLAGVRVGGTPYLPTRFRWGYGWPYFRGYKEVSAEEAEQVREARN